MRFFMLLILMGTRPAFAQDMVPEPFSDTGYLQSCVTDGELPGCMVVGYGVRYIAATAGTTNPAVMAQLQALAPNSRVEIAGDIISMGDVTAEVVLKSVTAAPDTVQDELMAGLQGDWQLAAGEGIQINGSEWTEIVEGQPQAMYMMAVGQPCSDNMQLGGPSIALITMGGDPMEGMVCYAVDSIDERSMTLTSKPDGAVTLLKRP